MNDRQHFLDLIKAEPGAYEHRYIYADWLDDHGEHDEADRQRRYESSKKWLMEFACDHDFGHTITDNELQDLRERYPDDYDYYEPYCNNLHAYKEDSPDAYDGNPFVQLVYFLERHISDDAHYLPFETPHGFTSYSDELWEHFEIVTGKRPSDQYRKEMPPFRCSC